MAAENMYSTSYTDMSDLRDAHARSGYLAGYGGHISSTNRESRDMSKQSQWHEAHRDMAKNMYRTSYSDMSNMREVHVRSEYPAGYGGHIPSLRHDVLFRNTSFSKNLHLRRTDPCRDSHPSFEDQISGLPTITAFPNGAKKNPTLGVVRHDGTTTMPKAPWGILGGASPPLNQRTVPVTMRRNSSAPSLVNAGAMNTGLTSMGRMTPTGSPGRDCFSPAADRLRRTVQQANEAALGGQGLSETEILAREMQG